MLLLQTHVMPQGGNYETTAGHSNRTLADSIGSGFFLRKKKVDTCDACFASPVLRIMKNQRYPKTAPLKRLRVFACNSLQWQNCQQDLHTAQITSWDIQSRVSQGFYFGLVDTLIYFVCRASPLENTYIAGLRALSKVFSSALL